MNYKNLSRWLKASVLGTGGCTAFIYFIGVPVLGRNVMLIEKGAYDYCYRPWLGLIWATSLPVALGLWLVWKFAENIGLDCAFCTQNAQLLRLFAVLSVGDGILFLVGNVLYLALGLSHISILLLSFVVMLAAGVIAVVAATLAQLIQNATTLQKRI